MSKTAVFLIWGDSRTASSDKPATTPDSRVMAWDASQSELTVAKDPLYHTNYLFAKTGFAVEFGKLYADAYDCNVVLVPAGKPGSGFQNDEWLEDGYLYNEAVQRFNDAFEAAEDPVFAGMLGVVGTNNVSTINYADLLDDTIARFRSELPGGSPETPSILLEIQEDFLQTSARDSIQSIIEDLPNRVAHTAVVDNAGIRSNDDVFNNGDVAHDYDVDTIAQRYFDAIDAATSNDTPIGTQLPPVIAHSYVRILESEAGDFIAKVGYAPVWMDPAPDEQEWVLMRSYNADLTNAEQIASVTTKTNVWQVEFEGSKPDNPDGMYYFVGLKALNTHGASEYYTLPEHAYVYGEPLDPNNSAVIDQNETSVLDIPNQDETLTLLNGTDPAGGDVRIIDNTIVFTPAENFSGVTQITYTIKDGFNNVMAKTLNVAVTASSDSSANLIESTLQSNSHTYHHGKDTSELYELSAYKDVIASRGGNDVVFAGAGDDEVYAGAGADKVWGQDGNDFLSGSSGNDTLYGGNGNDILYSGGDSDTLYGGGGTDKLIGGHGADTLNGGGGSDFFMYNSLLDSSNTTADTITDFETGKDKIQINFGLQSLDYLNVEEINGVYTVSITGTDFKIHSDMLVKKSDIWANQDDNGAGSVDAKTVQVTSSVDTLNLLSYNITNGPAEQDIDSESYAVDADHVALYGNTWKVLDLPDHVVSDNSVFSVDFYSHALPEIQGLQFRTRETSGENGTLTFNFFGSQDWGRDNFQYDEISTHQTFDILLGDFLHNGTVIDKVTLISDFDAGNSRGLFSSFGNIKLYDIAADHVDTAYTGTNAAETFTITELPTVNSHFEIRNFDISAQSANHDTIDLSTVLDDALQNVDMTEMAKDYLDHLDVINMESDIDHAIHDYINFTSTTDGTMISINQSSGETTNIAHLTGHDISLEDMLNNETIVL